MGDTELALECVEKAIKADPEDPMLLYNVACTYAMLGWSGDCLDTLERAVGMGWADEGWLEHDSDLDWVRGDVRYLELIRGM